MADLSVIIVNYNSGWFTRNLVDCLEDQAITMPDGTPGTMEILVVDNDSPEDQEAFLAPLEARDGVSVIRSDANLGYSGGNNLGLKHATGRWLMVTNPDVVLMPGSLKLMLDALQEDPQIGIVGPRGWLDPGFHFLLPPVEMPSLGWHLYESAGRVFKPLGRRFSMMRTRYALKYWRGDENCEADAISGFCFLMPMDRAREVGLFDRAFPFYYEDTDLSMRLGRKGYKRVLVRGTKAVHFYNKSAGQVFDQVLEKYYFSKSLFFRKHTGRLGHALYRFSANYLRKHIDRHHGSEFVVPEDLGELAEAPVIDLPEGTPVVVELTLDRAFVLAVAHFHAGGPYRMPEITWDALDPTTWYLRVLDAEGRRIITNVTWRKTTPGSLPPVYARMKEGIE